MKLMRIGQRGHERPAVVADDGTVRDVSSLVPDFDPAFFANGGLSRLAGAAARTDLRRISLDGERIGAPIAQPTKIVCIGLNYVAHADESRIAPPEEPPVFFKAPDCMVGPNDDVLLPIGGEKTDWEVELAVVMGAPARYLPDEDSARQVIAGYAISNDVSERAFQLERGGQWVKGKSCETFNPFGPVLVTSDEIEDVQSLDLSCKVNGETMQHSNTRNMIFGVHHIVWYLSQFMVLQPGDVINTGTPEGVALGQDAPRYLAEGDRMKLAIDGLGEQEQLCRRATLP